VGPLRRAYLQVLYRYQETHAFLVEGQRVSGQIVGVEDDGRLAVAIGSELRRFGMQEIRHA
jgi:BirA family biotin operon repressor/biotin-[acetyl-CoA-carboxylase] ligase